MDGEGNSRYAYDKAKKILDAHEGFCARAVAGEWVALEADGEDVP